MIANDEATPLRILLVEDNEHDRAAIRRALDRAPFACEVTACGCTAEAQARLGGSSPSFDVVVVDHGLPDVPAVQLCRELLRLPLPIVALTGPGSERVAAEAMNAGASDYIMKDSEEGYLELLPVVLNDVVRRHRERSMHEAAEAELQASQARLSQIVDGSSVATFVIDRDHRVTHWNRASEAMTGTPAAEVIGTRQQWRAFYSDERPVLADLILDGALDADVERFYAGKFGKSALIEGAYEAEDFFPKFGEGGRWLFFTAAPLRDAQGRIIGAIETLQDFTERRRAEAALRESEARYRELSVTDGLTGIYNARHFYERLQTEIARSDRYGHSLSLLLVDVDDFKFFNDNFGHLEGDGVLRNVAEVIRQCLRRTDSAYRYGGEEFTVLLPDTEIEEALQVAERLRAEFADLPLLIAGQTLHGSMSIGVSQHRPGEDARSFIRRADNGCYLAKRLGKNRVAPGES